MNKRGMPKPPGELLDLATAYQRSKVLFAIVELGVPTMLAGAAQTGEEIARRLQIHPRAADRLLNASVALGLAYDFSRHRRMLDLGGGTGAMAR